MLPARRNTAFEYRQYHPVARQINRNRNFSSRGVADIRFMLRVIKQTSINVRVQHINLPNSTADHTLS